MIDFRSIVFRIYTITEYRQGFGARCPLCGAWNSSLNNGIKIRQGKKFRYHRCYNCGLKYKSFELISKSTD